MTAFEITSFPRRRLAEAAVRAVVGAQLATPQLLVRSLDVTPTRADDLLALLEAVGIIRKTNWSPEVLFKPDQAEAAIALLPKQSGRAALDRQLDRLQADGRIGDHDADEVRRFADYLADLAGEGITPARASRDRAQATKAREIYLKHYPEHAPKDTK